MPYYPLGYPDYAISLDVVCALAESGAGLIELGLPFSDPLADGPTIQRATQIALQGGMTTARGLEAVRTLRARGVQQPLVLMGYLNPLLAYGLPRFVEEAADSGADGFIVPDLPPEEAGDFQALCARHDLAQIFLLAPNATPARIALVSGMTRGFLYLVSVTGITGARQALPETLAAFVRRVRAVTEKPLAVGFGISTPAQVQAVGALAEGVIVGSALIRAVEAGAEPAEAAREFMAYLCK
ncbi:MAG: tryptophan synthase subunit alpha [Anaerolineales bacterium]